MCSERRGLGRNEDNKFMRTQLHSSLQMTPSISRTICLKAWIMVGILSFQMVSSSSISPESNSTTNSISHSGNQSIGLSANSTSPIAVSNSSTKITDKNITTNEYGGQQEASILRPLILKSLLNAKRVAAPAEAQTSNEETEEVTQTIMMPIKEGSDQEQVSGEDETSVVDANDSASAESGNTETDSSAPVIGVGSKTGLVDVQLKPEASLQLSNTEINNLLNDGEAPEIYKEREQSGHEVVVGEERGQHLQASGSSYNRGPRLNSFSSSNGFGEPGSVDYRLAHAASGEFDGHHYGGFSHRFGSGFEEGRLAQSPSEFGMHGYGHPGVHSSGYGHFPGYSHHSGLAQAGSEEYMPHGYGHGGEGFSHGGYMGSPRLEQHSSEVYGPSSHYTGGYGGMSHYAGGGSIYGGGDEGRLVSADSHMAGYHGLHSHGDSFGNFHGGYEPRGYASNDMRQQANIDSGGPRSSEYEPNRLYPLSPIVPNPEEESAASANQKIQQVKPIDFVQAHEPLNDEDITTVGSSSRGDSTVQHNSPLSDSNENQDDQQTANQQEEMGLVLNVPPTSPLDASRATVEFSRIGSAGYLAPEIQSKGRPSMRKSSDGKHLQDNYDPADNPAHAGKYIID